SRQQEAWDYAGDTEFEATRERGKEGKRERGKEGKSVDCSRLFVGVVIPPLRNGRRRRCSGRDDNLGGWQKRGTPVGMTIGQAWNGRDGADVAMRAGRRNPRPRYKTGTWGTLRRAGGMTGLGSCTVWWKASLLKGVRYRNLDRRGEWDWVKER